jgi:hypothetical protein
MNIPEINTYFVHIPKTGGTSVEMFFYRNVCGFPHMQPKDIFQQFVHHYGGRTVAARYHYGQPTPERLHTGETQHLSAWQLKQWKDPAFCNANYTFAFVRNPWHRFISEVFWKQQHLGRRDHTFLGEIHVQYQEQAYHKMKILAPHNAQQWKFVYDENMNLLVDDVFKLEEIDKAEKVLSEKLNMKVKFGWENKTNKKDYSEYLTPDLKRKLYPLIEKDLEVFGYE